MPAPLPASHCRCRVTPQGFPAVEAATATKAWQALYASDEAGAARTLGVSGEWPQGRGSAGAGA